MRGFVVLFLLLLASSSRIHAQTIEGRLLEVGSELPIVLGQVMLLTESGEVVAETVSDEVGFFSLSAGSPGNFLLRGERMGYRTRVDGVFDLGEGSLMTVKFRLARDPVPVDPLDVSVEARSARLELAGFYERKEDGHGVFLGPEEIAEKPVALATQLFRNIRRVRIRQRPMGGNVIVIQGAAMISLAQKGICYPRVMVDGNEVFRGGAEPAALDEVVSASEIVGIEIYRGPAEIPTRYLGARSACGLILVWTK